eukprot:g4732.t1
MLTRMSWLVVIYCLFRVVSHARDSWPVVLCESLSVMATVTIGRYVETRSTGMFQAARFFSIAQLVFYGYAMREGLFPVAQSIPLGTIYVALVSVAERLMSTTATTIKAARVKLQEKTD